MTVDRDRCLVVGYRCRDLGLVEAEVAEKEEEESDRERERERGRERGRGRKEERGRNLPVLAPAIVGASGATDARLPLAASAASGKNKKQKKRTRSVRKSARTKSVNENLLVLRDAGILGAPLRKALAPPAKEVDELIAGHRGEVGQELKRKVRQREREREREGGRKEERGRGRGRKEERG